MTKWTNEQMNQWTNEPMIKWTKNMKGCQWWLWTFVNGDRVRLWTKNKNSYERLSRTVVNDEYKQLWITNKNNCERWIRTIVNDEYEQLWTLNMNDSERWIRTIQLWTLLGNEMEPKKKEWLIVSGQSKKRPTAMGFGMGTISCGTEKWDQGRKKGRKTERKEERKKTSHPRIAHGQRYPMPCLEWSSEVVDLEQGSGPKGPMSCRTQGVISRRPEGEYIRPKRDLRFRGKILGLKIRYEIRG